MTRAEIRRMKKEVRKGQAVYMLTQAQIEEIKKDAAREGTLSAMTFLFTIPVLILHERYGWGNRKRLPEFCDYLTDYYFKFEGISPKKFRQMVLDKTGLGFDVLPEVR